MRSRVVVVQRHLPHYRLAFGNRAHEELREQGIDLMLLYTAPIGTYEEPVWAKRIPALSFKFRSTELIETAMLRPRLTSEVAKLAPDLLVLEDLADLPGSLQCSIYARQRGIPYLIWGLGMIPNKRRSRLRTVFGPLINRLYRHTSGFVCYSRFAKAVYAEYNKPLFLASNACKARPLASEILKIQGAIRARPGHPPLHMVSIGSLTPQKRIDTLFRAMNLLGPGNTRLSIIGKGAQEPFLRKLAAELGLSTFVTFHGELIDHQEKFKALSSADLGVLPGRGGLAIQELMWHGVPVVTGVADGTERDLIHNGTNGFCSDTLLTDAELAEKLVWFGSLPAAERQRVGEAALETVRDWANVETMVSGFVDAVRSTLSESPRHA